MKIAVLAWGSIVWERGVLEVAATFMPNGPNLPVEFCRVSGDERLTLVIDETWRYLPNLCSPKQFWRLQCGAFEPMGARGVQRRAASKRCPKTWAGRLHRRFFGSEKRHSHATSPACCRSDHGLGEGEWLRRRDLDGASEQIA